MISREEIDTIPFLQGISSEAAASVADHLSLRTFLPGEYVFLRGDPGHSMFIILEGKVVITLTNAEGHDYTVATLQEGSFFGELGLLAGEPRSGHVKAIFPVLAAEIDQKAYQVLNRVFPEFNARLMQLMEERVTKRKVRWQGERVKSVKGVSRSLVSHREPMNEECLPGVTQWARDLNRLVEEIASTDANVLINGEPGTERVFIARLLISKSKANCLPSLAFNCSKPPRVRREDSPSALEEAQESALFGHVTGSTSYAKGLRRGYLDIADTGTLVLDHVEDLVPKVQTLLLRYLQSSHFSRIGSNEQQKSKVRIISTTTRDLETIVEQGEFNRELFELLRGRTITIIPLRERKEDIPAMAQEFLTRYRRRNQEQVGRFSTRAMNALVAHKWPLNFAELNTVISQAVAVSPGKTIEEEHIFFDIRSSLQPAGKINLLRRKGISRILAAQAGPRGTSVYHGPVLPLSDFLYPFWPPGAESGQYRCLGFALALSPSFSPCEREGFLRLLSYLGSQQCVCVWPEEIPLFSRRDKKIRDMGGDRSVRFDFLDRACDRGISPCPCYRSSISFHNRQRNHHYAALWKESMVSPYLSPGENAG